MIRIKREEYCRLVRHALACLPEEACGLLGGRLCGGDKLVEKVYLLTNADHSPEHFSLDPQEQLLAVKDMRALGLAPLGNWHSHPLTLARPSAEDKRLAFDSSASYFILSLQDREKPVLKSFRIRGDAATEDELEIAD